MSEINPQINENDFYHCDNCGREKNDETALHWDCSDFTLCLGCLANLHANIIAVNDCACCNNKKRGKANETQK